MDFRSIVYCQLLSAITVISKKQPNKYFRYVLWHTDILACVFYSFILFSSICHKNTFTNIFRKINPLNTMWDPSSQPNMCKVTIFIHIWWILQKFNLIIIYIHIVPNVYQFIFQFYKSISHHLKHDAFSCLSASKQSQTIIILNADSVESFPNILCPILKHYTFII